MEENINARVKKCYEAMKELEGDDISKLLEIIPTKNLICLLYVGMNIFYESFEEIYSAIEKDKVVYYTIIK